MARGTDHSRRYANSGDICHCGSDTHGSDHCSACGCEQYECGCDEQHQRGCSIDCQEGCTGH